VRAETAAESVVAQLLERGVAVLPGAFAAEMLAGLRDAAARCFEAVETNGPLAARLGFNRFSHSVPLRALGEFGCCEDGLLAPLSVPGLEGLFSEAFGYKWKCRPEQSWVRKKFAPVHDPGGHPQGWHQDGALGVRFPAEAGTAVPMTRLLTCWIPLNSCGRDSPGLEFVCRRQAGLLHFTELDDAALRRRFAAEEFWAPELELGDAVVFLDSVLHRTYARPEMRRDRMSVEYRIFPV
jgi:hypothetical protein